MKRAKGMLRMIWAVPVLGSAFWSDGQAAIQLQSYLTGLSKPIFVTSAGDGTRRIFVVEQGGRIKVAQPGGTATTVFLDLGNMITTAGNEQGLLGLAFHPDYARNRRFFVNYTRRSDGATVIAEHHASVTNSNVAQTNEISLLTIAQPFDNHNGGMIAFGADGYLYIGMGDGGSGDDPGNRAQDLNQLLGKILRIDVNIPNGPTPYSSPPDNPFFGAIPGRDEIYAYGMRNPWRWSFDRGGSHQLYVGDVGQGTWEEIDIIVKGGNYGWRIMEGNHCNPDLNSGVCTPPANAIAPIAEYPHSGGRCSITGGYIYRGARAALPVGAYIFGDYCTGEILQLNPPTTNGAQNLLLDTALSISSFGEDEAGELYVADISGGSVRRIATIPAPVECTYSILPASQTVAATGGNGAINVTPAPNDCAWMAASHNDWITLTSGANGVGGGEVHFTVAANTNTSLRMGTITVAGNAFTITQVAAARLGIVRSGTDVIISWPTNADNYVLQSTPTVSPADWNPEPSLPSVSGTNFVVVDTIYGPTKFYRLYEQ